MPDTLQLRGGTTADHSAFAGAVREVTVDTDKGVPVIHDGTTPGGFPAAREDHLHDWTFQTGAYTAMSNDKVAADTSGAAWTLTLPASPATGDWVLATDPADAWATNALTVDGNGANVEGGATTSLAFAGGWAEFLFDGTAWAVRRSPSSLGDLNDVDMTTAAPVAGDVSKYDGANWVPTTIAAETRWTVQTAAYTAAPGDKVLADTTTAAWTLTLPAGPAAGDVVEAADGYANFATNALTVDGNGNNIGGATTVTLSTAGARATFVFDGAEWKQL